MNTPSNFDFSSGNFSMEEFIKTFFSPTERALSDEHQSTHGGIPLPFNVMARTLQKRDMQAGLQAQGGALVTDGVDKSIYPYLRASSVLARMGAEIDLGWESNTRLPVGNTDFTATFLPEYGTAPENDFTVGNALLTPHRVSVVITVSQILLTQSAPDLSAWLADQILSKIQSAVDIAGINGTGGVAPIGLMNTVGVQSITWGGVPTWSKVLSFEEALGNANLSDGGSIGWLHSPATRALFKGTQRASGSSAYLESDQNTIAGYRSLATTTLNTSNANDRIIHGDFSKFVIGYFGNSLYLTRNPYTKSKTGDVEFTAHAYVDLGTPYPAAFVISSDSSIQ